MTFYCNALLEILFQPKDTMEIIILIAGGILLVLGFVNLFREKFLARGIFMIIDAVFYTAVCLLSANMILSVEFLLGVIVIGMLLNLLNWPIACGVSVWKYLLSLAVIGGTVGTVVVAIVFVPLMKVLPQTLPSKDQFLGVLLLVGLELVAYVGASVNKSDKNGSTSGSSGSSTDDPFDLRHYTDSGDSYSTIDMALLMDDDSDSGDIY